MAALAKRLVRGLFDNPVLLKELRIGMREKRIFIIQLLYLAVLSFAAIVLLSASLDEASARQLPEIGRGYYALVFWLQLVLVLLVTPSLTCGSLTVEKERQSLDMMIATCLTPAEIVCGKLGFALAFMSLVVFSSLPLMAVVFFLGGVSPQEVARSYVELAVAVLLAAEVGLFFSARETRSSYATNQTYGTVFLTFLFLVPFYASIREGQPAGGAGWLDPWWGVAWNALYAALFLFLKALNHLRSRAVNVQLMCGLFLPFYAANLSLMVSLGTGKTSWGSGDGWAYWNMMVLGHLCLAGLFLNDPGVESRLEREKLARSLFSRPFFWLFLLSAGLGTSGLVLAGTAEPEKMMASAGYGVLLLLSFSVIARSVHRLLGGKSRFAVTYWVLLGLACLLPLLGLLGNAENPGPFSGVYLSPVMGVAYLWDPGQGHVAEMSAAAYTILPVLAALAARMRRSA